MSNTIRKTGGRNELDALHSLVNAVFYRSQHSVADAPVIADGTTAGKLKTTNSTDFTVAGLVFTKAGTDDLWDLTAEVDLLAGEFRAYWLYVDAAGVATFVAGPIKARAVDAKAQLPALDLTQAIFGTYVAGPLTDFDDVGGLAAQGTIEDGAQTGLPGVPNPIDVTELVAA